LLLDACERYAAAVAVKPDKHEALYNWGNTLTARARLTEGAAAEALFADACERYAAAVAVKPDLHEALYNWGNALDDRARLTEGAAAGALFADACERYAAAVAVKPDKHAALYNWGSALADRAGLTEGAAAEALFADACERYAAAIAVKPDMHEALNNWGIALVARFHLHIHAEICDFLGEAEKICIRSAELSENRKVYNLACVKALQGKDEECLHWLETALAHDTLPSVEHLMADRDLESVRDKDWFRQFIAKVEEQREAASV
ncbi:MAG TPA: hypothetical protein PK794_04475, partial [Armatimonadota bacterium]|nr:hypothetical protein [Armatimonadota bacterium]